jgi:hypothetical protein
MEALLPALKEFGFPIALCIALLWAISALNRQLVKAYTDRIRVLEGLVNSLSEKVADMEADRIRRADEYGHTLKDLAVRWSSTIRDHNDLTRSTLDVLRRLTDSITGRPCLASDEPSPHPHPGRPAVRRPPSSADLPCDPTQAPTDRIER